MPRDDYEKEINIFCEFIFNMDTREVNDKQENLTFTECCGNATKEHIWEEDWIDLTPSRSLCVFSCSLCGSIVTEKEGRATHH